MNLIEITIRVRVAQFFRILKEIGIIRTLVLAFLCVFSVVRLDPFLTESPEISAFSWAILLFSIQTVRPDKSFFRLLQQPFFAVFGTEYLLLSLPLLVYFAYWQCWAAFLLILAACISVPFLPFTLRFRNPASYSVSWLPAEAFEWKSGIRLYFLSLFLLWGATLSFSFWVWSVPAGVFLLLILTTQFYNQTEELAWLRLYNLSPKRFLGRKIQIYSVLYYSLISPLLLAFLFFHTELYPIILLLLGVSALLIGFVIVCKYAFYRPAEQLPVLQWLYLIAAACLFIPFLAPVPLVLGVRFYFKALKNLQEWGDR